jgi:hypothetical protein
MYPTFHVLEDMDGFFVLGMSGLEIEKTANHRQIVFNAMMDFAYKSFLPLFAGAQLDGHLFGDFLLLDQGQNSGNHERQHDCRSQRSDYGKTALPSPTGRKPGSRLSPLP